jgi:type IV secretory pathway TrbF-like protein
MFSWLVPLVVEFDARGQQRRMAEGVPHKKAARRRLFKSLHSKLAFQASLD